jgi:hypothetical protein
MKLYLPSLSLCFLFFLVGIEALPILKKRYLGEVEPTKKLVKFFFTCLCSTWEADILLSVLCTV